MSETLSRKELFERWSSFYDPYMNQDGFPFIAYDQVLRTVIAHADFIPHHRVLDLGVGTGNLARRIPVPQAQIWGVDFSIKMLRKASKVLPNANFIQVNLLDTSWPPEMARPFNRIISGYTLHEFPDDIKQKLLVRLAEKYLGTDGLIVIGDISFQDLESFKEGHAQYDGLWDEDEYYWCAQPMTQDLVELGFSVEYTQISPCAGVYVIKYLAEL